jgi:hypothetical protein
MDTQKNTGWVIVALLLALLVWLLNGNGNGLLHGTVTASVGGVPVTPPDFYSGANAPPVGVGASGCVGCGT